MEYNFQIPIYLICIITEKSHELQRSRHQYYMAQPKIGQTPTSDPPHDQLHATKMLKESLRYDVDFQSGGPLFFSAPPSSHNTGVTDNNNGPLPSTRVSYQGSD